MTSFSPSNPSLFFSFFVCVVFSCFLLLPLILVVVQLSCSLVLSEKMSLSVCSAQWRQIIHNHKKPWPLFVVHPQPQQQNGITEIYIGRLGQPLGQLWYQTGDANGANKVNKTNSPEIEQLVITSQSKSGDIRVRGLDNDEYPLWLHLDTQTNQIAFSFEASPYHMETAVQVQMGEKTCPPDGMLLSLWVWYVSPQRRQWLNKHGGPLAFFSPDGSTAVLYLNNQNRIHRDYDQGTLTFVLSTLDFAGCIRLYLEDDDDDDSNNYKVVRIVGLYPTTPLQERVIINSCLPLSNILPIDKKCEIYLNVDSLGLESCQSSLYPDNRQSSLYQVFGTHLK